MTPQDYFAVTALSNSGMRDLMVSPLRYWWKHVNPSPPLDEPSDEMIFGKALHCAVLELDDFDKRYAVRISAEDYPGCLVTIEDLRNHLKGIGVTPEGTRKADVIAQVQGSSPNAPIYDVLVAERAVATQGKTLIKKVDWQRLLRCSKALLQEPVVEQLLKEGNPEVPMFVKDADTGVQLKAKMDWVTPNATVDIKTFSQKLGKSIDRSVADAIWYEGYHRQAYLYSTIRKLTEGKHYDFVMLFVESDEPHEVRIKVLGPNHLYWDTARLQVRQLCRVYAECWQHFGTEPWKYAQKQELLEDEDMPQQAY